MKVKKVDFTEVDEVLKVYQSCVSLHEKMGFNQWDNNYPNKETIHTDIQEGWLFGLYSDKGHLAAVISITKEEPQEYKDLQWKDTSNSFLVIHRLCVSEVFLRKGYAKVLMEFAESLAIKNNNSSIRLDTFSLNKAALEFYKKCNYSEVGKVNFPKRKDADYTCFEKVLILDNY
jgi:ribosomal protein S18 acetylase RimI-like enzyme